MQMTQTMADTTVITTAIELACRAPSLHNSQPWRWVASSTSVDLFADPHRTVTSTDSSGREAIISCGAVLDHFRVAMAAVGWDTNVDTVSQPEQSRPPCLDRLRCRSTTSPQARRDRADAILRRRTNRLPFRAPKHWASLEPVLRSSFESDLVTLDVLADDARPRLAEASRLTEAMRRYDDLYHQELVWWTAPFKRVRGDTRKRTGVRGGRWQSRRESSVPHRPG